MLSSLLQKIDALSLQALVVIAGGLVVLCQLVAMALVVQGQVEQAHARKDAMTSERQAKTRAPASAHLVAEQPSALTQVHYALR